MSEFASCWFMAEKIAEVVWVVVGGRWGSLGGKLLMKVVMRWTGTGAEPK